MNIDLGCGPACRAGFIGVDILRLPGVRIIARAEALPFRDESVTHLWSAHTLEHTDMIQSMREIHRILKPGGTTELWLPHATGIGTWADPTHRRGYAWRTWDYFRGAYDLPVFHLTRRTLCWKPRGQYPRFDRLVNLCPAWFEKFIAPLLGGCHETGAILTKPKKEKRHAEDQ